MGRQKIVIRVAMEDAKKQTKALKIAAGFSGVIQAGIEGVNRDRIRVVGEGIDSVKLTMTLRKKVGSAELIIVTPLQGMNENGMQDEYGHEYKEGKHKIVQAWPSPAVYSPYPYYAHPTQDPTPSCAIS